MKRAVVACKVLEAELRLLLPPDIELRTLEQGLHRTPELLRQSIQQEIDSLDTDEILLGYGQCGNGVAGVCSDRARLVVPRVDDCISILLGSYDRYREEFHRVPGTYWLSHGWIQTAKDPYKEYQRCLEKYDEATARWVAHEMMKGYHRLVLIDTGACPMDRIRAYARQFADFFGLDYEELPGSDAFLRTLLSPGRQNHQFLVIEPGQQLTADMFLPALGTANG